MKQKQKTILWLMTAALCVGTPANRVGATEGCSHWQTALLPQRDKITITYDHKVYYNLYVGNEQLYSMCHVDHHTVYKVTQCVRCRYEIEESVRGYTIHSLGGTKEHDNPLRPY